MPKSELAAQRAKIARLNRRNNRLGDAVDEEQQARSEYAVAKISDYVERVVAEAPPLTTEQRARLAVLLGGDAA